jgi:hypothetical protein
VLGRKAGVLVVALFVALAVADVDQRRDVVRYLRRQAVANHADTQTGRGAAALAPLQRHLALPIVSRRQCRPEHRQRCLPLPLATGTDGLADQFMPFVAGAAAERPVGCPHMMLGVVDDNALAAGLKDLGPEFEPVRHQLEGVDRGERGQHRATALKFTLQRGQHSPGWVRAAVPAHLELVHRLAVGQSWKKRDRMAESSPQRQGSSVDSPIQRCACCFGCSTWGLALQ